MTLQPHSLLALLLLLSSTSLLSAVAGPTTSPGISLPLRHRSNRPSPRNADPKQTIEWLNRQRDYILSRYGRVPASSSSSNDNDKRGNTATVGLTEQTSDQAYYGTVSVGTPRMSSRSISTIQDYSRASGFISSTTQSYN